MGTAGWPILAQLAAVGFLAFAAPCMAAVYYVDFDGGSDAADGRSPASAFRRCPGDPEAVGTAGAVSLDPGDTVVFKGGVTYRGSVRTRWSGSEGRPVTYDGNTAGAFGTGRAVVDGSEPITDWKGCESAAATGGNPHWEHLWYTDVHPLGDFPTMNLCQGDRMLTMAQDPNPVDPFYPDDHAALFLPVRSPLPEAVSDTVMAYSDPAYFTQSSPDAWEGAWFLIYARPNRVHYQKVVGYEPDRHRIPFRYPGERIQPLGGGRQHLAEERLYGTDLLRMSQQPDDGEPG